VLGRSRSLPRTELRSGAGARDLALILYSKRAGKKDKKIKEPTAGAKN